MAEGLDAEEPDERFLNRLGLFWAGRWGELIPTPPGGRVEVVGESEREAWLAKPLAARRPERSPQQEWDFVRGRVSYLLSRGDQRRARRLMESIGMAPRTEASYWALVEYHPPAAEDGARIAELQPGEGECPASYPDQQACIAQLRHGSRGASGGGSRWRRGHMEAVLNNEELTRLWGGVAERLALGPLPTEVEIVLGWCVLHGLLKDPLGESVRPLAVGEYFRRAIYSALLYSARDKCRAILFEGEGACGAALPRSTLTESSSAPGSLCGTLR